MKNQSIQQSQGSSTANSNPAYSSKKAKGYLGGILRDFEVLASASFSFMANIVLFFFYIPSYVQSAFQSDGVSRSEKNTARDLQRKIGEVRSLEKLQGDEEFQRKLRSLPSHIQKAFSAIISNKEDEVASGFAMALFSGITRQPALLEIAKKAKMGMVDQVALQDLPPEILNAYAVYLGRDVLNPLKPYQLFQFLNQLIVIPASDIFST